MKTRLAIFAVVLLVLYTTAKQTSNSVDYRKFSSYKYLNPFGESDESDTIVFKGPSSKGSDEVKPIVGSLGLDQTHQFWTHVFEVFTENPFNFSDIPINGAIAYIDKSQQKKGKNTKEVLLSKAYIPDEAVDDMKLKHARVLKQLPPGLADITFKKDTSGVVLVGGGRFSWLSFLSILALRRAGSELPVEIMMPTYQDYEEEIEFCTSILPEYGASCVVIPERLGPSVMLAWSKKLANYQFKSLALMTSSFQNILLLDSDNVLVQNPDLLMVSDVFKEYGMVTWPDYWERTISPIYYDIADVKVNENKRVRYNRLPLNLPSGQEANVEPTQKESVPFHDLEGTIPNLSTESGQLLINKATHGKTLLLSLYYNLYGPNLFYKLFSLGEQGEGDKDTFVAAAIVTKQKYYQLKSFIKTFGYADNNNNFQGVAMGQKDPIADYDKYQKLVLSSSSRELAAPISEQIKTLEELLQKEFHNHNDVPVFAVHCNWPKLDPLDLMNKEEIYDQENGRLKYRFYGDLRVSTQDGSDEKSFELQQWETIYDVLCVKKFSLRHFQDSNIEDLCRFVENQVGWLKQ